MSRSHKGTAPQLLVFLSLGRHTLVLRSFSLASSLLSRLGPHQLYYCYRVLWLNCGAEGRLQVLIPQALTLLRVSS